MTAEHFAQFDKPVAERKLGSNPKDSIGAVKVSITKLPAVGIIHGAHAMMDGADKYGPFNWRENKVIASIYVDAAMRHFMDWFEGQETAEDSEVHHLGHAIACCAIILDAQETGNLIDDRPVFGDPDVADRVLKRLSAIVKRRKLAKQAAIAAKEAGQVINGDQDAKKALDELAERAARIEINTGYRLTDEQKDLVALVGQN